MKLPIFLFLFLFSTVIFGQTAVEITAQQQVDSLVALNRDLVSKNQFEEALRVIEQAEQLALSSFGRESAAFGTCRHNHARTFQNGGKLDEAVPLYLEVLDLRAKVLGKMNADYAASLSNLGGIYATKGDYAKAEPLFTEVVEIRAQTLGKENPDYLSSLGALALIYVMNGDYDQGEPLLAEVVEISARTLGKENAVYLNNLDYLAKIYSEKGDFAKAEPLYIESSTIKAKVFGEQHTVYIGSLINLAILYASLKDDYSISEQLYLKAIGLYRKEPMEKDLNYMTCLTNLGGIYVKNGDYSKAESFFLECLEIQAKTLSKAHPNYAGTLINLANLYIYKKEYAKSEALLLEARNIFEIVLNDKSHPFYVNCLMSLGSLYIRKQEYQKAEPLLLEVKEIRSKASKLASFSVINNLGSLYGDMGEYAKAEAQASEAKEIVIKNMGKECMEYGICLFNYYPLYQITNRIQEATATLLELINLDHYLVDQSSAYMSENQMHAYLQKYVQHTYRYFSFLQTNSSPELLRNTYNHALFLNTYLLENTRRLAVGMDLATPAIRDTFERWQGCRRRLADEYAKPISERRSIASLESEAEGYERTLTRHVSAFAETRKQPHWNEVRDRLHTGEAAIEFVRYPFFDPRETDSVMYAAFVLLPDSQEPLFIPLFEEKSLNSMLATSAARKADYVNAVYEFKTEANDPRAQKSLYELLWKPLEKDLAGIRTVYFSPSGLLHRLNLNVIPINDKETLSDRYHLVELGSTRQLVISPESNRNTPDVGQALLFGGVKYDLNSDSIPSQNTEIESNITGSRGDLNFSFTDSTDRGGSWNYLKWTEKEVMALEPILKSAQIQATVLKGYAATEEAFKSIGVGQPSPRILHIATHGFFFPDPKEIPKGSASGLGAEPVFKLSDHPMIRSGLILAGANEAWKTGKPFKSGMEDGILTAYEISQMDLSNTELVVLSACETGLGDIQGNEGVYGLQRAFKIAGAKYLIMSLWQVPDFQTQELMTTFYTNWLPSAAEAKAGKTEKMSIPDAFRAAQQAMREKYEHPYFWAGFVLVE